jgi:uncharacterized membrane protein
MNKKLLAGRLYALFWLLVCTVAFVWVVQHADTATDMGTGLAGAFVFYLAITISIPALVLLASWKPEISKKTLIVLGVLTSWPLINIPGSLGEAAVTAVGLINVAIVVLIYRKLDKPGR